MNQAPIMNPEVQRRVADRENTVRSSQLAHDEATRAWQAADRAYLDRPSDTTRAVLDAALSRRDAAIANLTAAHAAMSGHGHQVDRAVERDYCENELASIDERRPGCPATNELKVTAAELPFVLRNL